MNSSPIFIFNVVYNLHISTILHGQALVTLYIQYAHRRVLWYNVVYCYFEDTYVCIFGSVLNHNSTTTHLTTDRAALHKHINNMLLYRIIPISHYFIPQVS